MKNFLKAMDQNGALDAKIKEGVSVGPQIRQVIKDDIFKKQLDDLEKRDWESFIKITENFLGNHRSNDYKQIVEELLANYQALGWNMSLKINFLLLVWTFFPPTWASLVMNTEKDSTKILLHFFVDQ